MYTLEALKTPLAIVRYPSDSLPDWVMALTKTSDLWSITHTEAELSVICDVGALPKGITAESITADGITVDGDAADADVSQPWRALRVVGQLDFSLTGVLASLAVPLADAEVSIFALSTFDTDYVLVKEEVLEPACEVLARAGFTIT